MSLCGKLLFFTQYYDMNYPMDIFLFASLYFKTLSLSLSLSLSVPIPPLSLWPAVPPSLFLSLLFPNLYIYFGRLTDQYITSHLGTKSYIMRTSNSLFFTLVRRIYFLSDAKPNFCFFHKLLTFVLLVLPLRQLSSCHQKTIVFVTFAHSQVIGVIIFAIIRPQIDLWHNACNTKNGTTNTFLCNHSSDNEIT